MEGFRRNRFPAVVLQCFAGTLLLLYFYVPGARPAFEQIGDLKQSSGPWFAVISTALFAGLIPWIVLCFRGRIPRGDRGKHLVFYLAYWAMQGATVDLLYTWQAHWFGSGRDTSTLLLKTLVDQGPYNLLYATPIGTLLYGWKDAGFSWRRFRKENPWTRLRHRYIVIQISVWIVWIPGVLMIYCLPTDLQIPLFNLVICFFSLLLVFVSRG
jgi:hypothetical protein